MRFDVRSVHS